MPVVATLFGVAYLAASLGFFVLAALLLIRPIASAIGRAFLAASLLTAVVLALMGLSAWFSQMRVLSPLASLPTVAWCAFLIYWTQRFMPKRFAIYPAISLGILWLLDVLIQLQLVALPAQIFYLIHVLLALLTLVCAEQLLRNSETSVKWAVKHLVLAIGACSVFDVIYFGQALVSGTLEYTLSISRGILWALATPLLAVSAARNPSWELPIHVSREVVFHTFTTLLVGAFLILIGIMGYFVSNLGFEWSRVLQVTSLLAAALAGAAVLLSSNARARMRGFIDRNFYSYRYDYRKEWLGFTDALMQRSNTTVFSTILNAFNALLDAPGGAIYARDSGSSVLTLRNADGLQALPSVFPAQFIDKALPFELTAEQAMLFRSETQDANKLDSSRVAKVIVPLTGPKGLHGAVVLSAPRSGAALNREVLDLLSVAANQASALLLQYEVTEELLVAKQFDAFNKMSAFVVHDLKNLAAQLALLTANADQHRNNPEFQADMLDTVRHVTNRMKALLEQLANGATAKPAERLNVVDCVGQAIASKPALKVKPTLTVAAHPPIYVHAHFDRLSRIFGHLIQNASEALRDVAAPAISINIADVEERIVVAVTDNGSGMSEAFIKEKLFRPFSSTKQTGMGIGVFESANYLREIGGAISVSSALGQGTRFEVSLARASSTS